MSPSDKPKRKPKRKPKKAADRSKVDRDRSELIPNVVEKESIGGILLLLEEQDLSDAVKWYVQRLSEIYDEIETGKAPKVKLEILQELRDFIIPMEDRTSQKDIFDPAVEGTETLPGPTGILRGTGSDG